MTAGQGRFDSIGGTYDFQTTFGMDKQLFYEARTRTIVGSLSKGGADVDSMYAGSGGSLDGSTAIVRKLIDTGDEFRYTMQEHMTGMPTYGDRNVERGDYLAYKNMAARVNVIKTPAIPVVGKMAQQRVRASLTDLPAAVKNEVLDYTAEQMEIEYLLGLLLGASPSALLTTANGGLGVSLGTGSGGGAGVALMNRHFYTPDGGFLTYSTTPATWNSTVNSAINSIEDHAADYVTLVRLKLIRRQLDKIKLWPVTLNGKKWRSVVLTDPDLWYRIDHLLGTYYQNSKPRENEENPIFGVDHQLVYDGMLFLACPNLEKFRPRYDAAAARPLFGPDLTLDPRSYTTTSKNALCLFLGAHAAVEGYNGSVEVTKEDGSHGDGLEIGARTNLAYIRGEWYAKDGRTDVNAVANYSLVTAVFDEPGVGTGY